MTWRARIPSATAYGKDKNDPFWFWDTNSVYQSKKNQATTCPHNLYILIDTSYFFLGDR